MKIQYKIIIGLVVIIVTINLILAFLTTSYVNKAFFNEVQWRVQANINIAQDIYNSYVGNISQVLNTMAVRRLNSNDLKKEINGGLDKVFMNLFRTNEMDILTVTDLNGTVIFRAHNPDSVGDNIRNFPIIDKVIRERNPVNGTMVLDEEYLKREGTDLFNRACVKIKNTPKARVTTKCVENKGVFITAAIPLKLVDTDTCLGIIWGGYLLNNSTRIIDQINTKMFEPGAYNGKEISVSSIFLDDIRISTRLKEGNNARAVGSRLSEEVYECVIRQGKSWEDRAFVIDDWYLTSYKPIKDIDGKIIGSLAIGLFEKPFTDFRESTLYFLIIILSVSALVSVLLVYFYTKLLMRPIESIIKVSKRIMAGDLSARCEIRSAGEIGVLCNTFDQMAEMLEKHEKKISEEAEMQIIQAEKLASIGRLAAGIAHEINNPLTGVLTFAHFLKEKRANDEADVQDINVIIRETTRVRDIIRGLLDFARQSNPVKALVNINEIIGELLKLVKGQREFRNIKVAEEYYNNLPEFMADKNQLQQVFLNLLLNSGEAITGGGSITINTNLKNNSIIVSISDSGCGIAKEDMGKIFDPFFTTKPVGKGTGLGLSVSYGIVKQHGGTIECESKAGEGATFRVILPLNNK